MKHVLPEDRMTKALARKCRGRFGFLYLSDSEAYFFGLRSRMPAAIHSGA